MITIGRCVVCEKATSGSLEFCKIHYRHYHDDIKERKPWVKALKNEAQKERRRKDKEFDNISLDALISKRPDYRIKD